MGHLINELTSPGCSVSTRVNVRDETRHHLLHGLRRGFSCTGQRRERSPPPAAAKHHGWRAEAFLLECGFSRWEPLFHHPGSMTRLFATVRPHLVGRNRPFAGRSNPIGWRRGDARAGCRPRSPAPRLARPATSFGPTFEWYLARELERRLRFDVVAGAKFHARGVGGDLDVVAAAEGKLVRTDLSPLGVFWKVAGPDVSGSHPWRTLISLVDQIRNDLKPLEDRILRYPYLEGLEAGRVERAALKAFAFAEGLSG